MVSVRRVLSILFCLLMAGLVSSLAVGYFSADGIQWIDAVRIVLLAASTGWLAWGAAYAFNGLLSLPLKREDKTFELVPTSARTAVLVPVYNEDPVKTFSHVAAMIGSLHALGVACRFDFAILSDTRDPEVAEKEERWFQRLQLECGAHTDIFYRRREQNTGKKAGNVADFIRTSGALYEYMIVLDADSLMEGATMAEMVRRMDDDPRLGLLQTLPKIVHARSFFGRAMQFSTGYYSPIYTRGLAALQGTAGPFWGHNAIVRTRAFAQSCGLPELSGRPPFGGHILSHDYVEAALLTRNGWTVRVDPDLTGSYEEGPDNVVDFAKRDRRWCQGNLQHGRVVVAPGLKPWSRFVFVQNIMAYVASPLWALFIIASIAAPTLKGVPDYFPEPGLSAVFPRVEQGLALTLLVGVFGLLIGPKLLIVARGAISGVNETFGGTGRALLNTLTEILSTSLLAPIMLMYQCRAVLEVFFGMDGGWPATDREAGSVSLSEAWSASWWISATGLVTLGLAFQFAPEYVGWLLLVAGPQVFAPILIHVSSRSALGTAEAGLFETADDRNPSPVVLRQEAILAHWRGAEASAPAFRPVPEPAFEAADAER
ncbi:glucans biosynthesis glucosyltransferase MdoH [Nitratireductor aquimarinus]|uniref:glucans biosynthesis glucosyltransferase MdoH n=1 Tax=Nitratireductor aquimarinus TaxID=889300 RepID=UPI002935480C|nr:glucans biosynthesis glucosyltransferase MdoH [Nitratireductor aquimarinus]MDV2967988.1 glucans biosynthesis glucosyltransferase MdoH [Nitratireductor aquimarinus]